MTVRTHMLTVRLRLMIRSELRIDHMVWLSVRLLMIRSELRIDHMVWLSVRLMMIRSELRIDHRVVGIRGTLMVNSGLG